MKLGSKLTCKKKLEAKDNLTFLEGVEYNILYIDESPIFSFQNVASNDIQILVGIDVTDFDVYYNVFNYEKPSYWFYLDRLHEYFYTEKEVRMIKLERLNDAK